MSHEFRKSGADHEDLNVATPTQHEMPTADSGIPVKKTGTELEPSQEETFEIDARLSHRWSPVTHYLEPFL